MGRNLRAYRKARGLSQEAFAEVVGVHRTYMGGLERGERNLTLKSVERIAERISVDPVQLMTTTSPETSWTEAVGVVVATPPHGRASKKRR